MKKTAFIVPTYDKHFDYSHKMENSFFELEINADIFFIFTNQKECNNYNGTYAKKAFLSDNFPKGVDHRGIITSKKIKGVEIAMIEGYEYAIVMDTETTFIKNFDVYEAVKYLSNRKLVYSTTTNHYVLIEINRRCADFFSDEEIKKIKEITKDFTEFFWFNDLAFYDLKICEKFFKHVYKENAHEKFYSIMSSAHFDHIIYIYYCLLYEDYKIVNLNQEIDIPLLPFADFHLGVLESIGDRSTRNKIPENLSKQIVEKLNPFWMPYGTDIQSENCFMLFHQDRA